MGLGLGVGHRVTGPFLLELPLDAWYNRKVRTAHLPSYRMVSEPTLPAQEAGSRPHKNGPESRIDGSITPLLVYGGSSVHHNCCCIPP